MNIQQLILSSFDSLPECVCVLDSSNNFLFVNTAFSEKFLFDKSDCVGQNISLLDSPKNKSEVFNKIIQHSPNSKTSAKIFLRDKKDLNHYCEIKSNKLRLTELEVDAAVWIIRDITEEELTKRKLQDLVEQYDQLRNELKDAVYESTPEGKLIEINPAGLELFGFDSKEELMKVDIAGDLYLNPEDRSKFREILERDGYVKNYELAIKRKDGGRAIVLETSFVVKDRNGSVKCFRGILRDITKYKNTLDELKNSENKLKKLNASKDKFFSIIAHDLRSPFASLIGLSELLVEDINELKKDDIVNFAEMINEAANELLTLLENLLQWSRVQADRVKNEPVNFSINEIVTDKIKLLEKNARNKNISILNEVNPHSIVFADINMLNSVIQNLISNAIKFTNSGGQVVISSWERNGNLELKVKDNGIGMSKDIRDKLFAADSFITTKGTASEPGTGLGLKLCKELIEKNKGAIKIKSEPGEGSEFIISIPQGKI